MAILPTPGVEFKRAHQKTELYSDLNPYTPEYHEQLENLEAVYASLNSILATRPGERLFNPEFGIDLDSFIFDLMTPETELLILTTVFQKIAEWEPRVILDSGRSKVIPNYNDNQYELNLVFSIVGFGNQNFEFSGIMRRTV